MSGLSIKNRSRLPASRNLTVSVTWLSMPSYVILILLLVFLSYAAGVVSGSGGWYRETVIEFTTEKSSLRRWLMAPDLTSGSTPLMRDSLVGVEKSLKLISEKQSEAFNSHHELSNAYGELMVQTNRKIQKLFQATIELERRTNMAREASFNADNRVQELVSAVKSAQRKRAEEKKETFQNEENKNMGINDNE